MRPIEPLHDHLALDVRGPVLLGRHLFRIGNVPLLAVPGADEGAAVVAAPHSDHRVEFSGGKVGERLGPVRGEVGPTGFDLCVSGETPPVVVVFVPCVVVRAAPVVAGVVGPPPGCGVASERM